MIEIIPAIVTPAWESDIERGINAAAALQQAPPYQATPFGLQAVQGGVIIGHLTGKVFWDWLYVELLWVEPQWQHRGIGTQLMQRAEALAREQNLSGMYCWTQSWQAPEFYKRLGYAEFTRFENFPPGHTRVGLRKSL